MSNKQDYEVYPNTKPHKYTVEAKTVTGFWTSIRSPGLITIPAPYQCWGGGGLPTVRGVGGGGGFSGPKDMLLVLPNHAVYELGFIWNTISEWMR